MAMTADCKSVTRAVNTGGSIPPPTTTRDVGLAAGLQPSKLARSVQPRYVAPFHAGIAQLVERRPEEPSVSGSSPFASTRISGEVERNWCRTRLEPGESRKGRAGSIPALSAISASSSSMEESDSPAGSAGAVSGSGHCAGRCSKGLVDDDLGDASAADDPTRTAVRVVSPAAGAISGGLAELANASGWKPDRPLKRRRRIETCTLRHLRRAA